MTSKEVKVTNKRGNFFKLNTITNIIQLLTNYDELKSCWRPTNRVVYPYVPVGPIRGPKIIGTHVNMTRCDCKAFAIRH